MKKILVTGAGGTIGLQVIRFLLSEGKYEITALDLKGLNVVNPIATILSAAMMLKYSFGLDKEYEIIENAVRKTLKDGYRTQDIMQDGMKKVSTSEMGDIICSNL